MITYFGGFLFKLLKLINSINFFTLGSFNELIHSVNRKNIEPKNFFFFGFSSVKNKNKY